MTYDCTKHQGPGTDGIHDALECPQCRAERHLPEPEGWEKEARKLIREAPTFEILLFIKHLLVVEREKGNSVSSMTKRAQEWADEGAKSERNRIIQLAEGMKREIKHVDGPSGDCGTCGRVNIECGCFDFNSALSELLSEIQEQ